MREGNCVFKLGGKRLIRAEVVEAQIRGESPASAAARKQAASS